MKTKSTNTVEVMELPRKKHTRAQYLRLEQAACIVDIILIDAKNRKIEMIKADKDDTDYLEKVDDSKYGYGWNSITVREEVIEREYHWEILLCQYSRFDYGFVMRWDEDGEGRKQVILGNGIFKREAEETCIHLDTTLSPEKDLVISDKHVKGKFAIQWI